MTHETRSHTGVRIDDRRGGRYVDIPSRAQETGCGTGLVKQLSVLLGSGKERQRLGDAARKLTCERYSIDVMLERYRKLYLNLSGRSRATA
jgi:hypothetical protein